MDLLNLIAIQSEDAGTTTGGGGGGLLMIGWIVILFAIMYFVMIRPQKKKQKEEEKLRNSIEVGDEILTIGGIYGRVISVKDDSFVIESASDHSKIKIARWAVNQNLSVHDNAEVVPEKKSFFGGFKFKKKGEEENAQE